MTLCTLSNIDSKYCYCYFYIVYRRYSVKKEWFKGDYVELQEMLQARDLRAMRQKKLLNLHRQTLICFTLNIPGPIKRFPLADWTFKEGMKSIKAALTAARFEVTYYQQFLEKTGHEAFFSVKAPADKVKKMMILIEDSCAMGRIFDIDVIQPDGTKVQRDNLGYASRSCFLCGLPAVQCARSRTHSVDQLQQYVGKIMIEHFFNIFSDHITELALRSLLYEISVTPKPGLVDRINNGAHNDMDFFTFLDSCCTLIPYFKTCVSLGLRYTSLDIKEFLMLLRTEGVMAEEKMFAATCGVNTHKGAIFSLGLLCAAAGRIAAREHNLDVECLCNEVQNIAKYTLEDYDFKISSGTITGGELAYIKHGITGIRGEAASGFLNVRKIGLPELRKQLEHNKSLNDAGVFALLHLMKYTSDTNVIKRGGKEALDDLKGKAGRIVNQGFPNMEDVKKLDEYLTKKNISPGGCADLLAVTFFLYFISSSTDLEL